MKDPCIGSRRLAEVLERDYGIRKRIQRLRPKMGFETSWCRPRRTSMADNGHRKYPYLLRDRLVEFGDEVWCSDIYLKGCATAGELEQSVRPWFEFYNTCASSIASTVRRIVCSPAHAPDRQTPRGAQSLPRHLPSPRRF